MAGEHCDAETLKWIKNIVQRPIFDHWWQTETGWPITSLCAGLMSSNELNNVPIGVSGKLFNQKHIFIDRIQSR